MLEDWLRRLVARAKQVRTLLVLLLGVKLPRLRLSSYFTLEKKRTEKTGC